MRVSVRAPGEGAAGSRGDMLEGVNRVVRGERGTRFFTLSESRRPRMSGRSRSRTRLRRRGVNSRVADRRRTGEKERTNDTSALEADGGLDAGEGEAVDGVAVRVASSALGDVVKTNTLQTRRQSAVILLS